MPQFCSLRGPRLPLSSLYGLSLDCSPFPWSPLASVCCSIPPLSPHWFPWSLTLPMHHFPYSHWTLIPCSSPLSPYFNPVPSMLLVFFPGPFGCVGINLAWPYTRTLPASSPSAALATWHEQSFPILWVSPCHQSDSFLTGDTSRRLGHLTITRCNKKLTQKC